MFLYFMRMYAAYHDVNVLSFCIMDNHFHLLVEVPPKFICAKKMTEAAITAFASR